MRSAVLRSGLTAGAIAAAATLGALLAVGHKIGRAVLPLGTVGAFIGGRHGFFFGDPSTTRDVLLGVFVQMVICALWGVVAAWFVLERRARVWWTACGIAVADFFRSWLVARASGGGLATVVPLGHRLELALVLGVALVAGIRLALPQSRE